MASGPSSFVVNLTGSLPGISQGLAANRPSKGTALNVWYLATDTQILYRWDGGAWVEELSNGGGGGTPDLQAVTAVGATTTIDMHTAGISLNNVHVRALVQTFTDYTALATDYLIICAGSGGITITLPENQRGIQYVIFNDTTGIVTITPLGGLINDALTYVLNSQHDSAWVQGTTANVGTGNYIVSAANIAVAGPAGLPAIVANNDTLAATGSIAGVVTYAGFAAVSTFIISVYINVTAVVTTPVVTMHVVFLDENGTSQSIAGTPPSIAAVGYHSYTFTVRAAPAGPSSPISVNTTVSGTGTITYDVGANIMKIN